jgi:hypothetical protein
VGAGAYNNLLQVGSGTTTITGGLGTIADDYVAPIAYVDLRASYNFGTDPNWQVYGAIDNLMDLPPPLIPSTANESLAAFWPAFEPNFYDTLGRVIRVGVRTSF